MKSGCVVLYLLEVGTSALAGAATYTNVNKENQENGIFWPILFGGKYGRMLLIFYTSLLKLSLYNSMQHVF